MHYQLLGGEALGVRRQVMAVMAVAGAAPNWMRKLVLALFRKPVSGRRPTGFFQSTVWMVPRWHSLDCKRWEHKLKVWGVFSMRSGRSPVGAVWGQQVRGDLAASERKRVLIMLADLAQCYELVQYPQLVNSAIDRQYQLCTLRFALR
eukprot:430997-Pyramimonas_sp.AAC.1